MDKNYCRLSHILFFFGSDDLFLSEWDGDGSILVQYIVVAD